MKTDVALLDTYEESGTDKKAFYDYLEMISSRTALIPFDLTDCSVLHYYADAVTEIVTGKPERRIFFWQFEPDDWNGKNGSKTSASYSAMEAKMLPAMIQEIKDNATALLDHDDKQMYMLSSIAMQTFLTKIGIGGEKASVNTLARDRYVASCFKNTKPISALVRKTAHGKSKIFAFFSQKYNYVPQTILRDIIHEIESMKIDMEFKKWYASNKLAECFVEFPSKAFVLNGELWTPGIRMCNSDTGYASTTIHGTWRIGDSVLFIESSGDYIKHYGDKSLNQEIRNQIRSIIKNQKDFEFTMKQLDKRVLQATSPIDLQNLFLGYFSKALKKSDLETLLGQKRMTTILCKISAETNWDRGYSLADIVVSTMKLAGTIQAKTISTRNKVAFALGKVPFVMDAANSSKVS